MYQDRNRAEPFFNGLPFHGGNRLPINTSLSKVSLSLGPSFSSFSLFPWCELFPERQLTTL